MHVDGIPDWIGRAPRPAWTPTRGADRRGGARGQPACRGRPCDRPAGARRGRKAARDLHAGARPVRWGRGRGTRRVLARPGPRHPHLLALRRTPPSVAGHALGRRCDRLRPAGPRCAVLHLRVDITRRARDRCGGGKDRSRRRPARAPAPHGGRADARSRARELRRLHPGAAGLRHDHRRDGAMARADARPRSRPARGAHARMDARRVAVGTRRAAVGSAVAGHPVVGMRACLRGHRLHRGPAVARLPRASGRSPSPPRCSPPSRPRTARNACGRRKGSVRGSSTSWPAPPRSARGSRPGGRPPRWLPAGAPPPGSLPPRATMPSSTAADAA